MTIKELMSACNFMLVLCGPHAGEVKVTPKPGEEGKRVFDEIADGRWKAEVAVIKERLIAEHDSKVKAAAERKAKIDAIDGLTEIYTAINDELRYRREFNAMMDDEDNDGACPPKRPAVNVADLEAKYPRAAAYVKAEDYSLSSNHAKSSAGQKALEKIINGDDYATALNEMEDEWSAYCDAHMWD